MANKLVYLINANRIEQPEGAEETSDAAFLRGIAGMFADPAGAAAKLKALADATAQFHAASEQSKRDEARAKSAFDNLASAQAAHETKLAGLDLAHQQKLQRRTRDVEELEKTAADKHAAATKKLDEANVLKVELQRRLDLVKAATA